MVGKLPSGEQDVVFSAYPLIATSLLLEANQARLGYKLIVDVQGRMARVFLLGRTFFEKVPHNLLPFGFTRQPILPLRQAHWLSSQTYLDRAKEANPSPASRLYRRGFSPKLDAAPAKDFGDDKTAFHLGTLGLQL